MRLADRLRELRIKRQAKLKDVADGTGLSVSYLSDLEHGASASLNTLGQIANFYHLSLVDLVTGLDGWGNASWEGLAPGLRSLLETNQIDKQAASDLNKISLRGKRPQTEDEWLSVYCLLKVIVERK